MSFTRKATVEMDGVSVAVAPLTCAQADEFLSVQAECLKADPPDMARLEKEYYLFVCNGYNNANGDQQMTPERLRAEMDKVLINALLVKIKAMSGLADKGETKAP
jgi:hypothetical protein